MEEGDRGVGSLPARLFVLWASGGERIFIAEASKYVGLRHSAHNFRDSDERKVIFSQTILQLPNPG